MSDEEDDVDILDDIKALELALAQESIVLPYENDQDHTVDNDAPTYNLPVEEAYLPISKFETTSDGLYGTVESAVQANARLLQAYKSALVAVNNRLNECMRRQQEVLYQIQLIERGGKANWRIPYIKAGYPYFKDENLFRAPANDDELLKQKRDEFPIVYSRAPSKWSPRGRTNLWKAARANASLKYLEIMRSVNRSKDTASDMDYIVPSDFSYILATLGDTELDWMRISVKDMKSRYTWQACKAMWNLHMKPTINREKWKKDEDKKLTSLAESHEYQNWDLIAKELGTQRTNYQCFVRYNTLNPPSTLSVNVDVPWTSVEDDLVLELVAKLRTGDMIPWTLVTYYLGTRTKNQIYCHWRYNLDPALKKGRFTTEEDQTLLSAANKYGANFPRIAAEFFPHRSTVQLSNRFRLLMLKTNESYNSWTIADDKRLLALYDEFGNNWSVIGNIMNKDRTYVRHHHAALTRHLSKGIQLHNVPRKQKSTSTNYEDVTDDNEIDMRVSDNIDVQLMRYFHSVHTPVAGPGRKRKYHTAKQLEARTKQLHDVFKKLHVNIDIPDDLDDIQELTAMDKQLLVSYKQTYATNLPKYTPDQIEEYRIKMFRKNKLDDDTEHFIPPAPFGLFQNVRKKGNSRKRNTDINDDDCNLELVMEFKTPKNIIEMLNDDEIKIFDKFSSFITEVWRFSKFIGQFEETYMKPLTTVADDPIENLSSQSTPLFSTDEKPLDRTHDTFIEPCYSTLVGYQCLLNMQKLIHKKPIPDDLTMEERVVDKDSKQAFRLLKDRLLTLFKYPVGMARIPVDYKLTNDDENDYDHDGDEQHVDDAGLNVPETMQSSCQSPTNECEADIDEFMSGHVEVSTPVRLSLNMIKTLRGSNEGKIAKLTISKNEL